MLGHLSAKEPYVPSVNPIQPPEPRVQPMNKQQQPSGDPFAEMLESAANKRSPAREEARAERPEKPDQPTSPVSRSKKREDALERGDQPKGEAVDAARGESKPAGETVTPETAADDAAAPGEATETDADGETSDTVASAPDAPVIASTETNAEAPAAAEKPSTEIIDPDLAASVTQEATLATSEGETAAAVPPVTETVEAPAPAMAAVPSIANADQAAEEIPVAAAPTTTAAAATASAQDGVAEAVKTAPAIANNMRAAAPTGDQAQAPQTAPANQNTAQFADAIDVASIDADQQLAQQQSGSPQLQAKPQETAARPAETSSTAPVSVDSAAPKIQPNPAQTAPMPEPVRALNASFDSAILNAANANDSKPVPLNGSAIAVEIVSRMREGMRRFDIRLDPPELGRIDVRLEVDRNGNVSTKLTVDRPETLDLMQREARGLERALQQAGLKTDAGGLEFSLRQHADERFAQGQGNSGHGDLQAERAGHEGGEPIEAVAQGYYRAAAFARGGVDITV